MESQIPLYHHPSTVVSDGVFIGQASVALKTMNKKE
jgi:hypothetical protein